MKVKVGDHIFDNKDEPIMIIMSNTDKTNLRHMASTDLRYATFPDNWGTQRDMTNWMNEL